MALTALGLVPSAVLGLGVHDPDCPHHRPGAMGSPHMAHGGHAGHGGAVSSMGAAPRPAGQGHAPSDPGSQDCHCFGVCIPGAHAVLPTLRMASLGLATLPQLHQVRELPTSVAPTIPVADRLPPATGPPQRA